MGVKTFIIPFNNSKIASYAHAQDTSKPWPTMRELIQSNKRLIVLSSTGGGQAGDPWFMSMSDFVFGTPWQYPETQGKSFAGSIEQGLKDLHDYSRSCSVKTGKAAYGARGKRNKLFLVQHMVTIIQYTPPVNFSGVQTAARYANTQKSVMPRVNQCWKSLKAKPNFILVDFYNLPSPDGLLHLIAELNAQSAPQ